MESLHLPHRPQLVAGRDLERGRHRQAGRHHRDPGQDYAFGRDGVAAFKEALAKTGATLVVPRNTRRRHDRLHRLGQRLFDALKDKPGRKIIWVIWAGAGDPLTKLQDMEPEALRHRALDRRQHPAGDGGLQELPGMEGATYYYYGIPKNPMNDWLVAEHQKRFNAPPDFFTAGGFAAAMAVVTAVQKAEVHRHREADHGDGRHGVRYAEGKMMFRKEDHQALQSMYHFRSRSIRTWRGP